jgi:hypothetical protein
MVWVLSDNHHLHLIKGTKIKGIEYQFAWRIAGCSGIFLPNGTRQLSKVGFLKLTL